MLICINLFPKEFHNHKSQAVTISFAIVILLSYNTIFFVKLITES